MRNGPNFFVIGAQRSGTTRFAHLLASHPDVAIPVKEPHYFLTPQHMRERRAWYAGLHDVAAPLRGDASTGYTMRALYPGVARRIHDHNPAARILYVIRHPIRRIESARALPRPRAQAARVGGFSPLVRTLPEWMVDPSLYWTQLSEYLTLFPVEQVKVVTFEDFTADEAAVVGDCWAFLGADPVDLPPDTAQRHRAADEREQRPAAARLRITRPRRLATRPVRIPPVEWDAALLAEVIEQVRPEAERVLDYAGRPPEVWCLPQAAHASITAGELNAGE